MSMNRHNSRTFHRRLFAGMLQKITVLKRDDDLQQGTVRSIVLYQCRISQYTKTGQTIQGDELSAHSCTWHIPQVEMQRTGINYFNPLDRIVDKFGRYWQPEAPQTISVKLFETHWDLECIRVDPTGITVDLNRGLQG